MAGSRTSSRRPVMNPAASGTQMANTARTMSAHGTGAFFGRMTSASQSGTASLSQSGRPAACCPMSSSQEPFLPPEMSDSRDKVCGMESTRYLDCLAADYGLLRAVAESASGSDPVPSCPGWTLAELVTHVGEVYLHKATVMRDGKWPDPWPPEEHANVAPLALLDQGYREVTAEFAAQAAGRGRSYLVRTGADGRVLDPPDGAGDRGAPHGRAAGRGGAGDPGAGRPRDRRGGRGAQAVRRIRRGGVARGVRDDRGRPPGRRGRDGHDRGDRRAGVVDGAAGASSVSVADGGDEGARAVVSATPDGMLRWLWGRADDSVITVTGDPEWAAYLRRVLAALTG